MKSCLLTNESFPEILCAEYGDPKRTEDSNTSTVYVHLMRRLPSVFVCTYRAGISTSPCNSSSHLQRIQRLPSTISQQYRHFYTIFETYRRDSDASAPLPTIVRPFRRRICDSFCSVEAGHPSLAR